MLNVTVRLIGWRLVRAFAIAAFSFLPLHTFPWPVGAHKGKVERKKARKVKGKKVERKKVKGRKAER